MCGGFYLFRAVPLLWWWKAKLNLCTDDRLTLSQKEPRAQCEFTQIYSAKAITVQEKDKHQSSTIFLYWKKAALSVQTELDFLGVFREEVAIQLMFWIGTILPEKIYS